MSEVELQDPWAPATELLDLDDYEAMETATYKYKAYQTSFEKLDANQKKHVVIIGAGQGGVVKAAVDAGIPFNAISAIEQNKKAFQVLKKRFPLVNCVLGDVTKEQPWRSLKEKLDVYPTVVAMEMMGSIGCNEAMPEVSFHSHQCIKSVWEKEGEICFIPHRLDILCMRSDKFPEIVNMLEDDSLMVAANFELNQREWNSLQNTWSFDIGTPVDTAITADVGGVGKLIIGSFTAYMGKDLVLHGPHNRNEDNYGTKGLVNEWWPAVIKGDHLSLQRISFDLRPMYRTYGSNPGESVQIVESLSVAHTPTRTRKRKTARHYAYMSIMDVLAGQGLLTRLRTIKRSLTEEKFVQAQILAYLHEHHHSLDVKAEQWIQNGKIDFLSRELRVGIELKFVNSTASANRTIDSLGQLHRFITSDELDHLIFIVVVKDSHWITDSDVKKCARLTSITAKAEGLNKECTAVRLVIA